MNPPESPDQFSSWPGFSRVPEPLVADQVARIDRELVKLAHALRAAILAEDHARYWALFADVDDLLDRRTAALPPTSPVERGC